METTKVLWLFILSLGIGRTCGQTLDPNDCIGPLTTASNCDFYGSKLEACNSLRGSSAADCYCPQTVLDAIAGCQSEFRVCAQGNAYDAEFLGSQGLFALWHSACDGTLTYSPTTSSLSSLATTFDGANCLSAESDCNNLNAATSACSATYQDASDVKSCVCQTSILEIASLCDMGVGSCLGAPPNSTDLFSYQACRDGQTAVTDEMLTSTRVVLTQSPDITSTQSAAPGPTASKTATSSNEGTIHGILVSEIWPVILFAIWFLA